MRLARFATAVLALAPLAVPLAAGYMAGAPTAEAQQASVRAYHVGVLHPAFGERTPALDVWPRGRADAVPSRGSSPSWMAHADRRRLVAAGANLGPRPDREPPPAARAA